MPQGRIYVPQIPIQIRRFNFDFFSTSKLTKSFGIKFPIIRRLDLEMKQLKWKYSNSCVSDPKHEVIMEEMLNYSIK